MPIILNDHTIAEIAAIREKIEAKRKREDRACLWCEKVIPMRADQQFCCASCRSSYSQAAARVQYERLQMDKDAWLIEREAMVREIAELRRLLAE